MLLLFCFYSCTSQISIVEYTLTGSTMGTTYNIKLISKPLEDPILTEIKNSIDTTLQKVNQQMSTYISDSEISQFNSYRDTTAFYISKTFSDVMQHALKTFEISNGAFDVTVNPLVNIWGFGNKLKEKQVPSDKRIKEILKKVGSDKIELINENYIKKKISDLEIDLSAIAKGYGVDVVSDVLMKFDFENFMVEIGGEIFVKGKNYFKEKWKIGIDKPKYLAFPGNELQDTLKVSNVAIATSGDYRNFYEYNGKIFSHTINPKTGKPVTHSLASVTIIASNCMQADALATAVLVLGIDDGLKLIESIQNVEGYLISRTTLNEFKQISSTGFSQYLN